VRTVIAQRGNRNPAQQFDVTLELDRNLPRTVGDPSQIEQVFTALLVHAEDAIAGVQHRPGSIQVRTGVRAGRIQLHVADNGLARDTARVFAPNPTGVGLNICAEIAKDHGGELYAWSAYGNGSTFTLELPIFIQDSGASAGSINLGRCLQNKSVMVVDDEVHISELVDDVLSRHGATVQISNSGSDAYERLRSKDYDLIICDQLMPGLSGQSLYRLMESANPAMNQRFLFMTGDVITAQAKQFFTQSGVQFLRKPFRIQDLLEAVEGLFSRSQPQGF
jgi:CheY-like chemotaxis protein